MRDELFNELIESIGQAKAILRGDAQPSRTFDYPDVKEIRARHNLSQSQFAKAFGLSPGTVRNWEQGRRKPHGPAEVLLKVAQARPDVVQEIVRASEAIQESERSGGKQTNLPSKGRIKSSLNQTTETKVG